MPARQAAAGTILVEVPAAGGGAAGVVVYARVSSHDQCAGLDRQVARVTGWVTGQGLTVAHGRRLIVADPGETTDDLVRDMIEVLISMCARLCGCRGAGSRAMRAVTAARNAEMDAAG